MEGQDSPPRHLRNVPAFRDLRIGSPHSWRSSLHRRTNISDSRSDIYELLDAPSLVSNQNTPNQSNLNFQSQAENNKLFEEAYLAGPVVGRPDVPQSQRFGGNSEDTITTSPCKHAAVWKELWFPLLCIHGSMLLVLGTLVVLIAVYRVSPERGLFSDPTGWIDSTQKTYVLLNIPATWLTFVTGRATQVAGLLAGPLMQLWTWQTSQSMVEASKLPPEEGLPTPYQLSLLVGILLASPDRLRRYFSYRCFRQQRRAASRSPRILFQAGLMLSLCFALATLMFAADTSVHYTTKTIQYDQVKLGSNVQASGRGLSGECLSTRRIDNFGYPCSINNLISEDAFLAERNEMLFLYHNTSKSSEIRTVASEAGDVALLLPKTENLSPYIDFRASTIGITTQCKPITPSCNFGVWGPDQLYSGFYCGSNFFGSLGVPDSNASTAGVDYPALAFSLGSNMLMAFFEDEELAKPYNPLGNNLETGAPDPDIGLMPDSQLINKVYVTFATRFASTAILANADLSLDAGFFKGPNPVYDTVILCSYESLHVDYTWFNGTIIDVQATPAPNGTISEIWHGSNIAASVSGSSSTLQTNLKQAAVQNSSTAFAQTWADLYSPVVMATIGGVSSARTNNLQQTRAPMLVVKVSIPALVFLGWCCLGYIVAGCVLTALAIRTASRGDIRDARARLTIFGLIAWAVTLAVSTEQEDQSRPIPKEQEIGNEADRVGLLQGPSNNFYFQATTSDKNPNVSDGRRWM